LAGCALLGIASPQIYEERRLERIATAHSENRVQTLSSMVFGDSARCCFCYLADCGLSQWRWPRCESGFQLEEYWLHLDFICRGLMQQALLIVFPGPAARVVSEKAFLCADDESQEMCLDWFTCRSVDGFGNGVGGFCVM